MRKVSAIGSTAAPRRLGRRDPGYKVDDRGASSDVSAVVNLATSTNLDIRVHGCPRPGVGMGSRVVTLAFLLVLGLSGLFLGSAAADEAAFEVWIVDQSDTVADGGGTLYIYPGDALAGADAAAAVPEAVDLGGAARDVCMAATGTAPRRPHMLAFNGAGTHGILSFVVTGHVLFIEAATRTPLACIDVGAQAHAAFPSPDGTYVVVANQNGKLLQRISTDYATGTFALDGGATIDLATCTTPGGVPCQDAVLRPDNAPICPVVDASSRLTFVTLRGGGLFVVDSRATPMAIVAEYDRATIHPNGCGGVEAAGKMYITSGGGTAGNPLESDLYAFEMSDLSTTPSAPNTPAPILVLSRDDLGFVDSHGAVLTGRGRFLWIGDRAANQIVIVDTATDQVSAVVSLAGDVSADPAPDLMAIAPSGNRVFLALRGPNPLTANVPDVNNAVGSTPGVGIVRVQAGGRFATLQGIAPISHVVDGVERADPHGIAVRLG
jgi:DNA-binding beta-propeller fold protein YncE